MSRSIVEIGAAVAAGLLLAGPAAAAAPQQVLYVGDSLGVGTTPGFARQLGSAAQVRGDSRVGRPSPEGLQALRQEFTPAEDVVVFDLGTNDDPARPELLAGDLAAARAATGGACLVVATLNRPPLNGYSVAGLNRAVEQFAARAPNVQLVDWHAYAASDPSLLGPDRVHPTPQGYAVRAQLFAQAVGACGSAQASAAPAPARRGNRGHRPKPRKPRPRRPPIKVPGIESSGISFSVPLRIGRSTAQLSLPSGKPPYPAVVVAGGAADVAATGVAVLAFEKAPDAKKLRAAVAVLRSRKEIERDRVALWGGSASVAAAAAADRDVAAVVAIDPAVLPAVELRDWRIRRALDGTAPAVTKWLRLRARGSRPPRPWSAVAQPVFAAWTAALARPAHAEAQALRAQLEAGPNRDRTFGSYATEQQAARAAARWLTAHLTAKPVAVTNTRLPASEGPQSEPIEGASAVYSWPVQIAWLLIPAALLLFAPIQVRRDRIRRAKSPPLAAAHRVVLLASAAGLGSLIAIAGGVAAVLDSDGRGVAVVAGTPWPFALAWLLAALAAAAASALLARRAYVGALGAFGWLALALFWLV